VVLQLSGGKDSLACLFLLEFLWPQLYVIWVNTGQAFPETVALMDRLRQLLPKFMEVHSDVSLQTAQWGPPVDLLPVRHHPLVQARTGQQRQPLQTFLECCIANIMAPLHEATMGLSPTVVVRGQKDCDSHKGPYRNGDKLAEGTEFWYPIQDWTDEQVCEFLKEKGELPSNYSYFNSSLDCWGCTAYLSDNLGKREYMRQFHPELHGKVTDSLTRIIHLVKEDLTLLEQAHGR
jgi:phosphoadenosine phosphosulfate reductase